MLPTPTAQVKPANHPTARQIALQQALIWGLFGGAALVFILTNLDSSLVHALHIEGGTRFTHYMREHGSLPAITLGILGLVALFWPGLWRKRPTLYQTAAVFTLSLILGTGLFNQIIVKNLADRPRPREVLLTESPANTQTDAFRGNSMPSGHAAVGFVLAAPFFPLRRRHPRLAYTFLATGLTAGAALSLSRIMLGAHYPSDTLIAAAIALSSAALLTALLQRYGRVSPTVLAIGTLLAGLCVVLGNRFSNLTLTHPLTEPFKEIRLPCQPTAISTTTPAPGPATLTVVLHGYGAPLSQLKLINNNNIITLQTSYGLYHNLSCTATITQPTE